MKLAEIIKELGLMPLTPYLDVEVDSGYTSDLLSNVMGKAPVGAIWVTMQCHPNVVAVASLLNLSAVVLVGGVRPDDSTLIKAKEEGVSFLGSDQTAFEVVGKLYALGLRGATKYE